jgi:hypothetical protein
VCSSDLGAVRRPPFLFSGIPAGLRSLILTF